MIDTLIFDFDGVIIDTETPDYDTWREVFQSYGVELERSWWSRFIGGASGVMDVCQQLEDLTGSRVDRTEVQMHRRRRYLEIVDANPLLPGVLDYIQGAGQQGLKLGVASSSPHSWVDNHLTGRGLLQYFDSVKCSDDVARVKPDPELYRLCVAQLGTRPENVVVIEDSANGITAAKGAGLYCVVVPNPMTKDLPIGHADLRLDSLADLTLGSLLSKAGGSMG